MFDLFTKYNIYINYGSRERIQKHDARRSSGNRFNPNRSVTMSRENWPMPENGYDDLKPALLIMFMTLLLVVGFLITFTIMLLL